MTRSDEVTPAENLENLAARIVEAESTVRACRNDVRGGLPGQADFRVTDVRDQIGLLEVTSVPDSRLNATTNGVVKGVRFVVPESRFIWVVTFDADKTVTRKLTEPLARALTDLERDRVIGRAETARLSVQSPTTHELREPQIPAPLNDALHKMGVRYIATYVADQPSKRGTVHWALTAGVTAVRTSDITDAVNRELEKCDNRKKLAPAAKTGGAQLFVWLDAPGYRIASFNLAEPPIGRGTHPITKPTLPEEINAVWVAPTPAGEGTVGPYWRSDGGPWVEGTWSLPDDTDKNLVRPC